MKQYFGVCGYNIRKGYFLVFCLLVTTLLVPLGSSAAADKSTEKNEAAESAPPKRILFTGNSFSFYNNGVHNHLGSLVRSADQWTRGKNRLRLLTLSGGHIHENLLLINAALHENSTINKSGTGQDSTSKFDAVVLQGHSNEPIDPKKIKRFNKSIQLAIDLVKHNNLTPILFMTWQYKNDHEMTLKLARAYEQIGNKNKIQVVPVGLAFAKSVQMHPDIELYVPDVLGVEKNEKNETLSLSYRRVLKHPSVAGTYLAANVFYASIYDKSPVGLAFTAGLDADVAKKLQQLAWDVSQAYKKQ